MDPTWAWVERGGLVSLLLFFLFGFYKGWWVFGAFYQRMVDDRDWWRDATMRNAGLAKTSTDVATRTLENTRTGVDRLSQIEETLAVLTARAQRRKR